MNGNIPDSLLRTIDSHGTRLRDWCADVWARMVADAQADGVTLAPSYTPPPAPVGLAGYRDYETQKWLYYHPTGPVPIAPPGSSTHGLGNRLDVSHGIDWIVPRMGQYGLWREFASEPWHFGFRTTLAGLGLNPILEEDEVKIIQPYGQPDKAAVGPGFGYKFTNYETYKHFCNLWGLVPEQGVITVGDASMTASQAKALFEQLVNVHREGSAPAIPSLVQIEAAVKNAVGSGVTVDTAGIIADIAKLIPTADQNGAAARAAIVKG